MEGDRRGVTEDTLEVVARVMATHGHRPVVRVADQLFQELTGVEADVLPRLLLGTAGEIKVAGARGLRDRLAVLFGCRRAEASRLLGVSDSRIRRNDFMDREMLDRAHAIIDTYTHVAATIRPHNAARWFSSPHPALDGQAPRQLLESRYGRGLVDDLVSAALAGSYI